MKNKTPQALGKAKNLLSFPKRDSFKYIEDQKAMSIVIIKCFLGRKVQVFPGASPPPPPPSPSASLLRTHFNPCYARGKTSLSRGKNIFYARRYQLSCYMNGCLKFYYFVFFLFFQQLHLALYSHNAGLVSTALKLMYRARYLALIVFGEGHPDMATFDVRI